MSQALYPLLADLAVPALRAEAAVRLARALGADTAILLCRDPDIGVLLPAAGFPQTIRGGPGWAALLRGCTDGATVRGQSDHPRPGTAATAYVGSEGTCLVLFGGEPDGAALIPLLPLVGALLRAEKQAAHALSVASAARAASKQAQDLATALDGARTELEAALGRYAALNARLHQADRRKDEFLAMLGHELRNPMAAISSALALIDMHPDESEVVARSAQIARRQAQQLTRLVDDLLDVARINNGKISLRLSPQDVSAAARRAAEAVQPLLQMRQHELSCELASGVWAHADPTRLEQMITNLLSNAAKYTPPGGRVGLAVEREGERARVSVRDDGVGIAPDMLPHVFEPFVQVDATFDRAAGGLGIGLTVVQRLAHMHGGEVTATSEVGVGSTFVLDLPACAPVSEAAVHAAPESAAGQRVLVIDDNEDSTEMMAEVIRGWGHEVRTANQGEAALAIAADFLPDVVLLDLGLPGMNGYEVAKHLRANLATRHARIIAVSGYGSDADREQTRSSGFDGHLVKPVDFVALEEIVSALSTSTAHPVPVPPSGATVVRRPAGRPE